MKSKTRKRRGPTKTWKGKERDLAALFGTERRALSGGNSKSGGNDDAHHDRLYLECKYRSRHEVWSLWRHCRTQAHREHRVPKRRVCIGLYEKGGSTALLVVHETDLIGVAVELLAEKLKAPDFPYSLAEADLIFRKLRVLAKL